MRVRAFAAVAVLAVAAFGLTGCGPLRTYTYRIATRGPVVADVGHFASHVQATLDDPRGWSLGGSIRFVRTDGPADVTIWLATAGAVPSFGPPCSAQWSCRQGANVVINEDRWLGATPAWPYDLDAYQHYVVIHELGHWMGFPHASCPGPWQRAPVMVQQSKGGAPMGWCRFNVWPTEGERAAAAVRHGVPVVPTGLPSPDDPFGSLDAVVVTRDGVGRPTSVEVSGWAIDGDTAGPLRVLVLADGRLRSDLVAAEERPDVAATFARSGGGHGFRSSIDVAPDTRGVCVVAVGTGSGNALQMLGCRVVK